MSKSEIRRKHTADTTRIHRRWQLASHTYKEGPSGRGNMRATQDAQEDKVQGPPVSLPEKGTPGGLHLASAEPQGRPNLALAHVQVHFEEEVLPRLLITFHMGRCREPASRTINRTSLSPSPHTPPHHFTLSRSLPLLLL
jgi:hypothetical protein